MKEDTFFRNVLIGFVIVFIIALLGLLTSCGTTRTAEQRWDGDAGKGDIYPSCIDVPPFIF